MWYTIQYHGLVYIYIATVSLHSRGCANAIYILVYKGWLPKVWPLRQNACSGNSRLRYKTKTIYLWSIIYMWRCVYYKHESHGGENTLCCTYSNGLSSRLPCELARVCALCAVVCSIGIYRHSACCCCWLCVCTWCGASHMIYSIYLIYSIYAIYIPYTMVRYTSWLVALVVNHYSLVACSWVA